MQLSIPKVICLPLSTKNEHKSSVIFAAAMYQFLLKVLFRFPPEWIHYFSMNSLKLLCSIGLKKLIAGMFTPKGNVKCSMLNIKFQNPVGLGAGFDKNAKYLNELEALGFGFVEIGTVTPLPQAGNEKPRLFRLPADKALINRMGFNNDGVKVVAKRLNEWKEKKSNSKLIIGGNIGKNKITPNEDAWKDYETCFKELHPYVDYFVVNVSSPNTPGLRELQEKESLRKILRHLQMINNAKAHAKPILLKIAPDLTQEQIDDVVALALEIHLDGLVVSNTTISRKGLSEESIEISKQTGGLSGAPLKQRNTDIVKYIADKTHGSLPIIASGGIFTAGDAKEKLSAGATLVQVWTGFIYEGPSIVKKICEEL
ncbi:MAG TPA: quinone-dependent dihydroorotate dehydrogenase [Chitinophagaceae bacterium]